MLGHIVMQMREDDNERAVINILKGLCNLLDRHLMFIPR